MCGDACSEDDIKALMDGAEADAVITDPPYNVNYADKIDPSTGDAFVNHNRQSDTIENDHMSDEDFRAFLGDAFTRMFESMKPGAPIYVFHADTEAVNFRSAFAAAGLKLSQILIWVKNTFVMGRQDYHWQHEPIIYGWKEGAAHPWHGKRTKTTTIKDDYPNINIKADKEGDIITLTDDYGTIVIRSKDYEIIDASTVIYHDKPQRNDEHPTMKPVGLILKLLKNSTTRGDIVLDPFGGSGSTMMACQDLKRTCYSMELDPFYCDTIIKRWEEATKQKAVLISK